MSTVTIKRPTPTAGTIAFESAYEEFMTRIVERALKRLGVGGEVPTPETLHRKHGYTPARLAAAAGSSRSTVDRIEGGKMNNLEDSTIAVCKRIAREIGEPEEVYLEAVQRRIEGRREEDLANKTAQ